MRLFQKKITIIFFSTFLFLVIFKYQIYSDDFYIDYIGELDTVLNHIKIESKKDIIARIDLASLFYAYPGMCIGISVDKDDIYLLMANGKRILYDDHKVKSYLEEMENADLQDMLAQPYPLGKVQEDPLEDFNPGGGRQIDFFKAVYGRDKNKSIENLTEVFFLGKTVLFNKKNGAAAALKQISAELSAAVRKKPYLKKYILPLGGTFNWRTVAGAKRLSPHAFGIAIDLNSKRGIYWQWETTGKNVFQSRQNYPIEIIDIFEKNNFIWGGKWFFYDLMHFEYRPEIFIKSRITIQLFLRCFFQFSLLFSI